MSTQSSEPTKQRSGDQPLPIASDAPFSHDLAAADMLRRKEVGIKRYGIAHQAFNGRDTLLDAYEEALDLCCYLRALLLERDGR